MDDPFVTCPYDSCHRVPRSRIQRHIIKCQARHPELHICPYNATHRFSETELLKHIKTCPSHDLIFSDNGPPRTGPLMEPQPILQNSNVPETDPNHEIWDD